MGQSQDEWRKILFNFCNKVNVDPIVFGCLISIESAWDPKAMRYEPTFIYLESPKTFALATGSTLDTEGTLQRFSWGLCQIMGANARAVGYKGRLTDLLDPLVNLEIGLKFFVKRCWDYMYPQDQAAAWNYGSVKRIAGDKYINQAYVDRFNQSYTATLEALKPTPKVFLPL